MVIGLDELQRQWLGQGASAPPPSGTDTAAAPATARLDAALAEAGMAASEITVAFLIGRPSAALVSAAFARFPALKAALIATPAAALPEFLHEVTAGGVAAAPSGRCFVLPVAATPGPAEARELHLHLIHFLVEHETAPSAVLLVAPAAETEERGFVERLAPATDLVYRFSAAFFAHGVDPEVTPARTLAGIADFLFALGDVYHALKYYWAAHHLAPERRVAWRILECWSELGCAPWVDRWLEQPFFPDDLRAKVRADILPDLTRDRDERATTFAENLAALAQADPGLAPRLTRPDPAVFAHVQLANVPWQLRLQDDGETPVRERADYPLIVRTTGAELVEVNPPPDFAEQSRVLKAILAPNQPHAAAIDWGKNAWAANVFASLNDGQGLPGWKRLVYFVERDRDTAGALLETRDLVPCFGAGRAQLFLGAAAESDFVAHFRDEPDHPFPGIWAGVTAELDRQLQAISHERTERTVADRQRFDADAATRLAETRAVLAGERARPLRVLFYTSIYTTVLQFTAEDLAAGFRSLGHEARVIKEKRAGMRVGLPTVLRAIADWRPDVMVLIDHTRAEASEFFPTTLPVVAWVQDELPVLKNPKFIQQLGPLDFTYAYNSIVAREFREAGYPHVGHLAFAGNPDHFATTRPGPRSDEVAFTTTVEPAPPRADLPELGPALERRLEAEAEIPLANDVLAAILDEVLAELGRRDVSPALRRELHYWTFHVARRRDRIRSAEVLVRAGIPLALYGRGWEKIDHLRPFHRGVVPPGDAIRAVYSQHKVVLHINRGCNLHPRLLEGYLAGAFVLARHDPSDDLPGETCDQFKLGEELLLYRDEREMLDLVRRAESDEGWRVARVEAARARILAEHTFAARARVIIEDLRQRL